jgi:hypothetical protein
MQYFCAIKGEKAQMDERVVGKKKERNECNHENLL